ncbi:MAG: type II secretion system protein GspG [Candidatus Omnitrophica bacterium]|nr:type II secretion system protein GspG [Candidatus Omnitrophota bacterium]
MKRSFTLIELIVVIAIIAILAAIIAPNAFRAIEKAKISKAVSDLKSIKTAVYSLYADTGHWPISSNIPKFVWETSLMSDIDSWPGWDGPYLGRNPDPCPWSGGYFFSGLLDWGKGPSNELFVAMDDNCIPKYGSPGGLTCDIPTETMKKIDAIIDDANLSTGDVRKYTFDGDRNFLYWAIVYDVIG